ncbi:unnamed protein product, partial [Dovyalis caffra]
KGPLSRHCGNGREAIRGVDDYEVRFVVIWVWNRGRCLGLQPHTRGCGNMGYYMQRGCCKSRPRLEGKAILCGKFVATKSCYKGVFRGYEGRLICRGFLREIEFLRG